MSAIPINEPPIRRRLADIQLHRMHAVQSKEFLMSKVRELEKIIENLNKEEFDIKMGIPTPRQL